jgi:hypothetical protein
MDGACGISPALPICPGCDGLMRLTDWVAYRWRESELLGWRREFEGIAECAPCRLELRFCWTARASADPGVLSVRSVTFH